MYDPFGVDVPLNLDNTHSLQKHKAISFICFNKYDSLSTWRFQHHSMCCLCVPSNGLFHSYNSTLHARMPQNPRSLWVPLLHCCGAHLSATLEGAPWRCPPGAWLFPRWARGIDHHERISLHWKFRGRNTLVRNNVTTLTVFPTDNFEFGVLLISSAIFGAFSSLKTSNFFKPL